MADLQLAGSVGNFATGWFDGSWFDMASAGVAFFYAGWHWKRSGSPQPFLSKERGFDFANGLSLFPLLMLTLAAFSMQALTELLHSNRLILTVAGVMAILAILEDEPVTASLAGKTRD